MNVTASTSMMPSPGSSSSGCGLPGSVTYLKLTTALPVALSTTPFETEQTRLQRGPGVRTELQDDARIERGRRFEFERRVRRQRKLQVRVTVHERVQRRPASAAPGADARSGKNDTPASSPLFSSPRATLATSCVTGAVSASGTSRPDELLFDAARQRAYARRLADDFEQRSEIRDQALAVEGRSPSRIAPAAVPRGSVNSFGSALQSTIGRTCSTLELARIGGERTQRDDAEALQGQEADR